DDDDIGVFGLLVTVGADDAAVKACHGTGLGQIQCLPLRDPLDNIDEDDVAQLLGRRPVGRRRSDVAGSDDRDLGSFSWHLACPSVRWSREKSALKTHKGVKSCDKSSHSLPRPPVSGQAEPWAHPPSPKRIMASRR